MDKEELKEKSTKVVGRAKRQMPYIVIMLLSIALTGVVELIQLGWSWESLLSPSFWGNMIITNVSAFLMAISSTLMTSDNIENNTTKGLGKQAFELNDVVLKASANVKNDIDIFIMQENLERKRKAYKSKIKRKIIRLESKFNNNDVNCYALYLMNSDDFNIETATRRVKKRIKLEELSSDVYIDQHIKYIKVKYGKISRKMIENGSTRVQEDGTLTKNAQVLLGGIIPKFILSFSLTVFISSFSYDIKKGITFAIIIPIITKIITLLFNYNYGRNFAPTYFNETTISNLQVRRQWLTKYIEWRELRNVKEVQPNTL